MFFVGRRRMAARLETKLILSVVPFSMKSLTLRTVDRFKMKLIWRLSFRRCVVGRKKQIRLPWSFMS